MGINLPPRDVHVLAILSAFAAEHDRAIALYPDSVHLPDGTGETSARQYSEDMARNACNRAHREGRLTHAHIFEEEACEVLNAKTTEDLRKELIQVGAMCLKWILDLDGRAT